MMLLYCATWDHYLAAVLFLLGWSVFSLWGYWGKCIHGFLQMYILASLFSMGCCFGWEVFRIYAASVVLLFSFTSFSRLAITRY